MVLPPSRFIILSAPSGSGKPTLVHALMDSHPYFEFSISATTRAPRFYEEDGKHYHFLSIEEFKKKISDDEFIEYEQVYEGRYYGTLRSEIERIHSQERIPLLDIDVIGGLNVKQKYLESALSIFIQAPSLDILEKRLRKRGSESEEEILKRIKKAEYEISYRDQFDAVIINDDLDRAKKDLEEVVMEFLGSKSY